ncbi:MAG TPA: hypothetical protein VF590_15690 [Isosphaeraceae bacterium]|jgi:hypothetical protein
MFAVHDLGRRQGRGQPAADDLVFELEDDGIRVYRGEPEERSPGRQAAAPAVTPVYGLGGPDSPAVPTGRVLVRFAEGIRIEDRRDQLAQAGYTLAEPLAYAPQAGWVRAASGGIAAALEGLPALAALPDVAHVEPQMLMPRSNR